MSLFCYKEMARLIEPRALLSALCISNIVLCIKCGSNIWVGEGWPLKVFSSSELTIFLPPWSSEHTVSSGVNFADTKWKLVTNEQPAVQSLLNKLHKPWSRRTWQKAALSENLANFLFKTICHGYSDLRAKWNGRYCWGIKQVLWKYFHTLPSCQKLFFSRKMSFECLGFFFFF